MSDQPAEEELKCANCGQQLDANDKFCRECGLPTMRHAAERKVVPVEPLDTAELQRALNAVPDPQPFLREEVDDTLATPPPQTTSDVIRATNPTHATRMAASTLIMIGLIVLLVIAGLALLVVAFQG